MFSKAGALGISGGCSVVGGIIFGLLLVSLAMPAGAQSGSGDGPPSLSVEDRLEDRRYVATGTRGYIVGTEDGRFPAMGFHTRGEMGGVWSPPIKLLDGIWFAIGDGWIGPAERFTSGYGHTKMELPGPGGLRVERTDFVPDGKRSVLVGLTFGSDEARTVNLKMDAHSELMGAYPWGETTPNQKNFNLEDEVSVEDGRLVFREEGTPPEENAPPHDWAAVVGSNLDPTGSDTGEGFRGPQDPADVCPAPPDENDEPEGGCDDTALGKGKGGQLRYEVEVPAEEERTVWFAISGANFDGQNPDDAKAAALDANVSALEDPDALLQEKVSGRRELAKNTRLMLPDDTRLRRGIRWSKQNLADSIQIARDLEVRETNAGENYPPPEGGLEKARFLGAGFPDYPWLFGTDGEYTAFASVGVGQFGPIKDHLRALKDVSLIDNGDSGKVVHEVVYDGSVFFGSNDDEGNTDETSKFPSAVALLWRWTGDDAFRDEMYDFTKKNMRYVFRELDEDGDGWPEGLGNVEREGMGEEKLDNAVYTIRGLYDLADMAESKGDEETVRWAGQRAREMEKRFEEAWWFGKEGETQYADSLDRSPVGDANEQIFQRHWIGGTPMDVEFPADRGQARPGLASRGHATAALEEREGDCYTARFGMYHTGTGPTEAEGGNQGASCDEHVSEVPSERNIFTLNTAIMAVGEGNYGRLGPDQQQRYADANVDLQLIPEEQPGAMPEIAPSPDYADGGSKDKPFNERAMVLQAWGAYGTIWPVLHQWLGVRPDLGRGELAVVPQVPPDSSPISARNVRLGNGSIRVSAETGNGTYRTTIRPAVKLESLTVGHTLPLDAEVRSVTLNGEKVGRKINTTNRGKEVLVDAPTTGEQTLIVKTAG